MEIKVGDYIRFKSLEDIVEGALIRGGDRVINYKFLKFLINDPQRSFYKVTLVGFEGEFKIAEIDGYNPNYWIDGTLSRKKFNFKKGDKVLVSDDGDTWLKRTFIAYHPGNSYPYQIDFDPEDEGSMIFRYCRKFNE